MEIIYFIYKYGVGFVAKKFGVSEDEGKVVFIILTAILIILGISLYANANPTPANI